MKTTEFYDDVIDKPAQLENKNYTGDNIREIALFSTGSYMSMFGNQTEVNTPDMEHFTNDTEPLFLPHLKVEHKKRSNFTLSIVRTHYNEKFIADLDWLSKNHIENSHDSFPYISSFLNNIKEYVGDFNDDIYCSFLLALYDSLVHEHKYLFVNAEIYLKILQMIVYIN